MRERQHHFDSAMEVVSNTLVGMILSFIVWQAVAALYGIPMPLSRNAQITAIFTAVSLARQWLLRRIFNGRSIWTAIRERFA